MKRLFSIFLTGCCLMTLVACEQTTQEQYFARAVLNSNLLYGFAGSGMQRQLASPSAKLMDAKTGASVPMRRAEILKDKLDALQSSFEKVGSSGFSVGLGQLFETISDCGRFPLSFPRKRESITPRHMAHRMDSRFRGNDSIGVDRPTQKSDEPKSKGAQEQQRNTGDDQGVAGIV